MNGDTIEFEDAQQLNLEGVHMSDMLEHIRREHDIGARALGGQTMAIVVLNGVSAVAGIFTVWEIERGNVVARFGEFLCLPAAAAADFDEVRTRRLSPL